VTEPKDVKKRPAAETPGKVLDPKADAEAASELSAS